MSITLGANGGSYSYPESGDSLWGDDATNYASAVSAALTSLGLGSTLNSKAVLDISSTSKGVLFPRMTTAQKNAISSPGTSLIVYDTDLNALCIYYSGIWNTIPTMTSIPNTLLGSLIGGIKYNTNILPATISSGVYEVNGIVYNKTSDETIALSQVIGNSRQELDTYTNYIIATNGTTNKYIVYGDNAVSGATGNISSIVESPSGTYSLAKSTGTIGSYTDKTVVITDGTNTIYVGKITGGNGTSTITFKAPAGLTFATTGTYTVYTRISTLHETNSLTEITTDANILKYTPSYSQNTGSSFVAFNTSKNGFYLTLTGYTDYRVVGNIRTNGSSQVQTDIVSHKSGNIKNDNIFILCNVNPSGYGSTDNKIIRWDFTGALKMFGCDYTLINTAANGTTVKALKQLLGFINYSAIPTGAADTYAYTINDTELTTSVGSMTGNTVIGQTYSDSAGSVSNLAVTTLFNKDDIGRCHTGGTSLANAPIRYSYNINFVEV